jgi:toxin ParE1/3/4
MTRTVRYSPQAEDDLLQIAEYTKLHWDEEQADRYVHQLETCCLRLVEAPAWARPCGDIRPGLRRIEEGSHVIFFAMDDEGILIVRVLHKSMLPRRNRF